jgi:hypothetical protein
MINSTYLTGLELMRKYCLDKNTNDDGNHNVHTDSCGFLPSLDNQINLGFHDTSEKAIDNAKKLYPEVADKIQGCQFCIKISTLNGNLSF